MRLIASVLLVALLGCGNKPAEEAPPAPVEPDAATLALLDRVGGRAALVVAIDLTAWRSLHGALAGLLSGLPHEAQMAFAYGQDPIQLLQIATGVTTGLSGLDRARPVLVGLGEAPIEAVGAAALAALDRRPIPGLIHRAAIPATDAQRLSTELEGLLRHVGAKSVQVEQGTGWLLPGRDRIRLAVIPQQDHVYVVAESASTIDFETAGVWGPPLTVTPAPRTRAAHALAQERHALALLLRPGRLRAAGAAAGAVQVVRALTAATPEHRTRIQARGLQIVLGCEGLMAAAGLDFEELLLGLRGADKAVRLRTVAVPTAEVARALDSAVRQGRPRLASGAPAVASLWIGLDGRALMDGLSVPAALSEARPGGLLRRAQECGFWGTAHLALGGPLRLMRVLEPAAQRADPPLPPLPVAAQYALLSVEPLATAAALSLATPDAAAKYRAFVSELAGGAPVDFSTRTDDGQPRAVVSVGDAKGAFGAQTVAADGWLWARLELTKLRVGDPVIDGGLRAAGAAEMRAWRTAGAIVGELVLSPASAKAAPSKLQIAPAEPTRSGPTPSPGAACLARAVADGAKTLDVVGAVAPDSLARVLTRGLAAMEADLACAEKDPATQAVARGLRRIVIQPAVERLARGWRFDVVASVLQAQCAATDDPRFCAGVAPAKKRAALVLPTARRACAEQENEPGYAHLRVLLDQGIELDGEPVSDGELAAAVRAKLDQARTADDAGFRFDDAPAEDAERAFGTVEIAVSPTATAPALQRLLTALRDARARNIVFPVRHQGQVRWAGVGLFEPVQAAGPDEPDDQLLRVKPTGLFGRNLRGAKGWALTDSGVVHPLRERAPESRVVVAAAGGTSAARLVSEAAAVCGWVELADPAELPEPGPPSRLGTRDKIAIQAVIRSESKALRYCYEKLLTRRPTAGGKLRARFTIEADGAVSKLSFSGDSIGEPSLTECLRTVILELRFPPAPTRTVITYPFIFESGD